MNAESQTRVAPSIKGHMINLAAGSSIAIYERNGFWYVAEFHEGRGEFTYGGTWFRHRAGGLRYCHNRRDALQFSMPLTSEMQEKIARLHTESEAREQMMMAAPWHVATTVKRCLSWLIARKHGLASKTSRTLG